MLRRRRWTVGIVLAMTGWLCTGCGGGSSDAGKGGTSPISIGFITHATGPLSSSFVNAQWGAEARFDAQNAAGGVNGHKINLIVKDDQSVPANNLTVAQELVQNNHVFGIIEDSSLAFAAANYLTAQDVPVAGAAIDGPEWGVSQHPNMFMTSIPVSTPIDGRYYGYMSEANFLKQIGVTKLAGLTYNLQSAQENLALLFQAAKQVGISKCYDNRTYQFGSTDFTSAALAIKSAGCNGAEFVGLLDNCIGLSSSLKNAGVAAKQICTTAYDQNLLDNPTARHAMEGDYTSVTVDVGHPNPATATMLANLKKYTGFKGGIPNLNIVYGYEGAELMIEGLEKAGPDPSKQKFITQLHRETSYTNGGMTPEAPVSFVGYGTPKIYPPQECGVFDLITKDGFVPYNNDKPVCGQRISIGGS